MSEFPFAEQDEAEGEGGNRRTLLLAGGLAAVLVLGAGGFFLTSGGGEDEEVFTPRKRTKPPVAAPAAPLAKKPATLPVAHTAPIGRDPFRALYLLPAAPPPPAPGTVAPPPAAPPPVTGPTTPGTKPPTTAPKPAPKPATLHTLVFRGVTPSNDGKLVATFLIDGVGVRARVGQIFGPSKEILLVSLQQETPTSGWTATLKVGDGAPFTVAQNEKVSVR